MSVHANMAASVFQAVLLLLCLKALLLGTATAALRGRSKSFINPEDADWLKGEYRALDPEPVARVGRAHRNDLENLLLFAIAGTILLALDAAPVAICIYAIAFLCARLLHSMAYLGRWPLLRRNSYTLGFVVILTQILHAIIALVL